MTLLLQNREKLILLEMESNTSEEVKMILLGEEKIFLGVVRCSGFCFKAALLHRKIDG